MPRAWHLHQHARAHQVHDRLFARAREARDLADGYPSRAAPGARSAVVEPVGLDRGVGDEAGAGGVGLRVDLELAGAGEEGGGAEGDLELAGGGGGELHGAAVEGLDALVLGS